MIVLPRIKRYSYNTAIAQCKTKASMQANTLQQFLQAAQQCRDNNEIYELFEYNTAEHVREAVYAHAAADSAEPFRSAMHALGFTQY